MKTAEDSLIAAQNDADRQAARAKLAALQQQEADAKQRVAQAKAAAEHAQRIQGIKTSDECQKNPLAKGCM